MRNTDLMVTIMRTMVARNITVSDHSRNSYKVVNSMYSFYTVGYSSLNRQTPQRSLEGEPSRQIRTSQEGEFMTSYDITRSEKSVVYDSSHTHTRSSHNIVTKSIVAA